MGTQMILLISAVASGILCGICMAIATDEREKGGSAVNLWAFQAFLYCAFMVIFITGAVG
jgi:hypothetical protein